MQSDWESILPSSIDLNETMYIPVERLLNSIGVDELDREDPDILDMYGVLEFMVMVRRYVPVFKPHIYGILWLKNRPF